MQARIDVWIYSRSFGFAQDAEGNRYFIHKSCIKSGVPEVGANCTFDLNPLKQGPNHAAINVVIENSDEKESR
jgi:cold shock CspA family protein